MKVIIADDDKVTTGLLEKTLRKWNFEVFTADNGEQTLEMIGNGNIPDIILLDWEMPVMDGMEVCRYLRSETGLEKIYIIMITSRDQKKDLIKGLEFGVDDYIPKPVDLRELRARIRVGERIIRLERLLEDRALIAENNYQHILDRSLHGIIHLIASRDSIWSGDNVIAEVNPALCSLLGYSKEEIYRIKVKDLFHPGDHYRTRIMFDQLLEGSIPDFKYECRLMTKEQNIKWVNISMVCLSEIGSGKRRVLMIVEDISRRKFEDMEMMKRMMKYHYEEGNVYFVREKVMDRSVDAFQELLSIGYDGIALSRMSEREFRKRVRKDHHFYWLAEHGSPNALKPNVSILMEKIEELPKKSVIFIDRLDYLIVRNDFDSVLFFIQNIREIALLRGSIIIVTMDPATVGDRELSLIEKECHELEPYHKINISEDLLMILKHIYNKHYLNLDANLNSLITELGISRPTARKRVNQLINFDYVLEMKKGRECNFMLTEKASTLFK